MTPGAPGARDDRGLQVGFAFNLKRIHADDSGERDEEAEYDEPESLEAIRSAIRSHGHEVVDLEATPALPGLLSGAAVNVVFNIAEGRGPRGREAQVPALLELLGIAYFGSDSVTLAVTLDKALAKNVVRTSGVRAPQDVLMQTGDEPLPDGLRFPLIAKPVHEGSSKGITDRSVVSGEAALRALVRRQLEKYRQPVLVEEYVAGREFTVGLLGSPPRVLPPLEVVFLSDGPTPVYSFEMKQHPHEAVRYEVPGRLEPDALAALEAAGLTCFEALGCRDVARLDFRLDADGVVHFLECNPLPGLTPGWSDICLIADAAGIPYEELIGEILAGAIRRFRSPAGW